MYVHALHTVHALPDLRVAGGRLGDGVSLSCTPSSPKIIYRPGPAFGVQVTWAWHLFLFSFSSKSPSRQIVFCD